MMVSALHYSTVRLSDLDPLAEWDLGKVLDLGNSIPAYRYSASESLFRDTTFQSRGAHRHSYRQTSCKSYANAA